MRGESRSARGAVCLVVWSSLLLFGAIVASAQAKSDGFEALDPSWLKGRTLTVPEANFSVDAPALDWIWKLKRVPGAPRQGQLLAIYCAKPGETFGLSVLVAPPTGQEGGLSPKFMDGIRDGFEKRNAGGVFTYQPSASPIQGSYAWHHEGPIANTPFKHAVGAVCWTGKVVQLMAVYQGDAEPKEYRAFLDSFHVLKPVPVPAVIADASALSASPYLVLMAVVLLIGGLLNRTARFGSRLNIWRGAGYALLIALVVHLGATVASTSFQEIRDPGLQGEIVGRIAGSALPAFLVVWLGSVLRKRKLAQRPAAPAGQGG